MADRHFRSEIAGLRAVAVISVILFHLKIEAAKGGFVGVDVFFVISGYLITRNILRDLQAQQFSLGQFYVRRVRRIFPALIFTVALTYLLGALWCSPLMFMSLAKEATQALLSISNVQYWRESHEYFAPNSDELALLHCWSLSLEEQFYLLWPFLLILAHRIGRPFPIIGVAALVSFASTMMATKTDALAVFFLMPFRIHEFAIGAFVLALETKWRPGSAAANALSATGLILIAVAVLTFDSGMPNLTLALLFPCLGAAMLIWAGDNTWVARIIANRPMVSIGAISYSLYLCHWPVIFFGRFIFGDVANSLPGMLAMIATMMGLATAMYWLVERSFTHAGKSELPGFLKAAAALWSVLLSFAAITHLTFVSHGFSWRMPQAQASLAHEQDLPSLRDDDAVNGPLGFVLIGDSQANSYIAGLSNLAKQHNIQFDVIAFPSCPIMYGVMRKGAREEECRKIRDQALTRLQGTTLPVIIAQAWDLYTDPATSFEPDASSTPRSTDRAFESLHAAFEQTVRELVKNGRRVLVIGDQVRTSCVIDRGRLLQGPLPHQPQPPCAPLAREEAELSTSRFNAMLAQVQAKWPANVALLRPVDFICDDAECPVVADGHWLYYDRTHFSVAGSKYMVHRASKVFNELLGYDPKADPKSPSGTPQ